MTKAELVEKLAEGLYKRSLLQNSCALWNHLDESIRENYRVIIRNVLLESVSLGLVIGEKTGRVFLIRGEECE